MRSGRRLVGRCHVEVQREIIDIDDDVTQVVAPLNLVEFGAVITPASAAAIAMSRTLASGLLAKRPAFSASRILASMASAASVASNASSMAPTGSSSLAGRYIGGQAIARRRRLDQQLGDLVAKIVGRHDVRVARGEDDAVQEGGDEADREVGDDAIEGFLRLVHRIPDRPVQQRRIGGLTAFILDSASAWQEIRYIWARMSPRRAESFSLRLRLPPSTSMRDVGEEGEGRRETRQLLVVATGFRRHVDGDRTKCEPVRPMPQGAETVAAW